MAVLFADVTDSTVLCRRLGDAAGERIVHAALETVRDAVEGHGGRVVKLLGDAALCVLPDAERAVEAACAVQSVAARANFGGEPVRLHIGVHFGPVLVEGDDVFGDTVNAAVYLAETATGDQVLATETVVQRVGAGMRGRMRPIFQAVLKGTSAESTVYQLLWRSEDTDVTTLNLQAGRLIPTDTGSLLVSYGDSRICIDQRHPSITLGRSADCDIVVRDMYASRQHATIKLRRMRFYLLDHSTNGTFVSMRGEDVHLLRGELLLAEAGSLSLGRRASGTEPTVQFERDRRSLYRV